MKKLYEETVSSELIYKGPVVELHSDTVLLENGAYDKRDVITHPGGVCVVPVDNDGNVYMVRQFRYPFGRVIEEIPAGKLNPGEDPAECGLRELKEEIGASAESFEPLGEMYPTPAYDSEIIYMYLARGLSFSKQQLDDDEFLEVYKIPLSEAVEQVLSGKNRDAKTQLALLKAKIKLEQD